MQRKISVKCPGYRRQSIRVERVQYLGTLTGNRDTGSEDFERILYRHPPTGIEIVVCEDTLNRTHRDYAESYLTAEQAERIGLSRKTVRQS